MRKVATHINVALFLLFIIFFLGMSVFKKSTIVEVSHSTTSVPTEIMRKAPNQNRAVNHVFVSQPQQHRGPAYCLAYTSSFVRVLDPRSGVEDTNWQITAKQFEAEMQKIGLLKANEFLTKQIKIDGTLYDQFAFFGDKYFPYESEATLLIFNEEGIKTGFIQLWMPSIDSCRTSVQRRNLDGSFNFAFKVYRIDLVTNGQTTSRKWVPLGG